MDTEIYTSYDVNPKIYTRQYPDLYKNKEMETIKIQAKFIQASTRTCIKNMEGEDI